MNLRHRLRNERGLTLVELLIGALIASGVTIATYEFYQAQHELYLAHKILEDISIYIFQN